MNQHSDISYSDTSNKAETLKFEMPVSCKSSSFLPPDRPRVEI